jgi:uncharacterized membrane protein YgdD (TMEM256/DUF423 family)
MVLLVLFAFVLPAFAQEVTPEPGFGALPDDVAAPVQEDVGPITELPTFEMNESLPEPDTLPIADPAVAFDMLIKLISSITVGFASAPFTVVLVSLLKRWPALEHISAPAITFAVGVVLWVGSAIAGALGYSIQFDTLLDAATTILPALAGLFAVLIGAPALHQLSAKADVKLLGYSRTPPAKAAPLVPGQTGMR